MTIENIPSRVMENVRRGTVIPAVPLALDANRQFDPVHQRALLRYYIDAGVGGLAVGVHSTQFEIRKPQINLFEPVLSFCSQVIDRYIQQSGKPEIFKIAGVCGRTDQALAEATFARKAGYHAGLLSLGAMKEDELDSLIGHCQKVAQVIPVVGFYLQPAVGGRILPYEFWRRFAQIENVVAIKIAPFNRYQTLEVVRGICKARRENDIALYTGNDDTIVFDLLSEYRIQTSHAVRSVRIVGGLLGHWAVWTKKAVDLMEQVHKIMDSDQPIPRKMITLAHQITDSNSAFFDTANNFTGCIPGIHEVLRRQGLFAGTQCLNPNEVLSPGQKEEIDRVYQAYPHLNDDAFVRENLQRWMGE